MCARASECGCVCVSGVAEELKERAQSRYETLKGEGPEHLVTGSDDFTLFLWDPTKSKKPLARMTGKVWSCGVETAVHVAGCLFLSQVTSS